MASAPRPALRPDLPPSASPPRPFERPLRRTGRRRRHRSHLFGRAGHGRAFRHGGRDEATGARAFSSSWAVGPSRPSGAGDGAHPRLGADKLLPLTCHRAGHLRLAQTGAGPPRLSSSRAHGQPAPPVTLRGQCGAVGRHGSWAERTTDHTGATARWSGAAECARRPEHEPKLMTLSCLPEEGINLLLMKLRPSYTKTTRTVSK